MDKVIKFVYAIITVYVVIVLVISGYYTLIV